MSLCNFEFYRIDPKSVLFHTSSLIQDVVLLNSNVLILLPNFGNTLIIFIFIFRHHFTRKESIFLSFCARNWKSWLVLCFRTARNSFYAMCFIFKLITMVIEPVLLPMWCKWTHKEYGDNKGPLKAGSLT